MTLALLKAIRRAARALARVVRLGKGKFRRRRRCGPLLRGLGSLRLGSLRLGSRRRDRPLRGGLGLLLLLLCLLVVDLLGPPLRLGFGVVLLRAKAAFMAPLSLKQTLYLRQTCDSYKAYKSALSSGCKML